MFVDFKDFNGFGVSRLENVVSVTTSTSKRIQAIVAETANYSVRSFGAACTLGEKLAKAGKPEEAFELHSNFAKNALDDFVKTSTKLATLYSQLAQEALKESLKDKGESKVLTEEPVEKIREASVPQPSAKTVAAAK
jgi:hypothetical protein